ncbi:MAG: hypothetical protein K0R99_4694 [Microbacterium sp.]|nr:hypothetical protein [Microbacterium sp.]
MEAPDYTSKRIVVKSCTSSRAIGASSSRFVVSADGPSHRYVTDSQGAQNPHWKASGRLLRIDRHGAAATVLASDLRAPNGLAFTPEADGLWVSQNTGNRIDFLRLDAEGTAVATAHPAVFASVGEAQIDSLANDADGLFDDDLDAVSGVLDRARAATLGKYPWHDDALGGPIRQPQPRALALQDSPTEDYEGRLMPS